MNAKRNTKPAAIETLTSCFLAAVIKDGLRSPNVVAVTSVTLDPTGATRIDWTTNGKPAATSPAYMRAVPFDSMNVYVAKVHPNFAIPGLREVCRFRTAAPLALPTA